MEYNNYYPAQPGHPPPPPHMANQQPIQIMSGGNMMHGPVPHQNMRQVVTPGPPPGHQPMQPQPQQPQQPPAPQHLGPHHIPQPMPPQQHPHPNYHQLPPHPPPLPPHASSPHPQQQPPMPHHNPHQTNMNLQPPSRPSTGASPQQHPHMHTQSPHHMNGPSPMHVSQQPPPPPPQQLNQIVGGGPILLGPPPPGVNQPQPSMQPHQPHNQNFMGPAGGGPPNPPMSHHPNQHYSQPPPPPPPHSQPPPPLPPLVHQGGPGPGQPPPPAYLPHHVHHPSSLERGSPFYQNIPQTEFRIIELNKRLQNRPRPRGPPSPQPRIDSSEESYWWEKFACDFFDDDSTLTLRIAADDKPVEYTIGRTLIPRFFRSYFEGGVTDLSIKLRNTRETTHPHIILLECDQTDITTKNIFRHPATNMAMNVVVHTEGHLSLEFVSNSFDTLLIKSWKFYTNQCHEYIDRSMTTSGLPNAFLVEPVTRYGLTKSTIVYLKMCMIMEPMQDLMLQHRQSKMDPRSCLKHLLVDKYKLKNIEDNRAPPSKRRKRRTPAATTTGTTKKTKANANNANAMNNNNNNIGFNNVNNNLLSTNLSLASQDVMVVGEPSMLGADFGDENERRITRLENNQFDASINSNNTSNNSNSSNANIGQNQNQMCNNAGNQNPNNQPNNNNLNHMQAQNNHESGTGSIQIINHNSTNNGTSDLNNVNSNANNGNNCLQNNNNHQMNLISMNGNVNHLNHIVKTEIDPMKQSQTPTPTVADSEAR